MSRPAAVMVSASSNQPREGSALTGGWFTVTATMPGSTVLDVMVIGAPGPLPERGEYLSKHLLGTLAQ